MSFAFDNQQVQSNLDFVAGALAGTSPDQKRIAQVGLQWLATLLRKNADYGSSVWKSPALKPSMDSGDAILVRMSDKVSRIGVLSGRPPQVTGESFEDTINDLGSYCLLYLARPPKPTPVGVDVDSGRIVSKSVDGQYVRERK